MTVVDTDDIVGAGAPGGSTRFIEALLGSDRGLRSLVPLHDPVALDQVWQLPVGSSVDLTLRGTPGYDQPEVAIRATVGAKCDSDLGRRLRLDVGTTHIAVSADPPLVMRPKFWKELGISPRRADLVVQKSFFHYRIFYAPISFRHVPMVSQGATSLKAVAKRVCAVPSYPSADPTCWRPGDLALRARDAHARPGRATPVATQ